MLCFAKLLQRFEISSGCGMMYSCSQLFTILSGFMHHALVFSRSIFHRHYLIGLIFPVGQEQITRPPCCCEDYEAFFGGSILGLWGQVSGHAVQCHSTEKGVT